MRKVNAMNKELKCRMRVLVMLLFAFFGANAQSTDFSGYWSIANADGYSVGNVNNYYLVPARDPQVAHYADAYFNDQYCSNNGSGDYTGDHYGDPEKPFLTTHRNDTDAEPENLIWHVVSTGDGYYYIIHALTGKYVLYEPPYQSAVNRKSMHLQETDSPSDNYKFEITGNLTGNINIRPFSLTTGNRYWNPATNNYNQYYANGGNYVHVGMIGVYNSATDTKSCWRFEEDVLEMPTFTVNEADKEVTIKNDHLDVTIYYTLDGSTPDNTSSSFAAPGGTINIGPYRKVVKAVAYRDGVYTNVATIEVDFRVAQEISSLDEIVDTDGFYQLIADIDDASSHTTINSFTGRFDGQFHTISGLTQPLFGTVNNATVYNIVLKDVNIENHEGNTGAIACEINEGTCVYNCGILSGSVGGTGDTGGIVGLLTATTVQTIPDGFMPTRVINCYSYADITSAGEYAAGIVGNNMRGSTSQITNGRYNNLRTVVVNCMFYGDVLAGTNKAPVYGNKRLQNSTNGINNYNYFMVSATLDDEFTNINQYNCSWPVEERFLTRFEYFRNILNSNRRLCTWWITQRQYDDQSENDLNLMAKWVLDPSIAPCPILKPWGKYPSNINVDQNLVWDEASQTWKNRDNALPFQGKKLGTLSVTVKAGSHNSSAQDVVLALPILDMDTLHHDFSYAKVQLPYYNEQFGNPNATTHAEKYGNNYTDKVVTGWKITSVTEGTQGTFVENWESGYNFADRYCTEKDIYAVSGRVFAQGGYYYVPEGVTAITIEAYWGNAVYLHNKEHSIDRVNLGDNDFTPAGKFPATFNGQQVYADIKTAINSGLALEGSGTSAITVYDQALVLVGNLQHRNSGTVDILGWTNGNGNEEFATHNRPFTITSVDLDFDNEPDYCFEWQFSINTNRLNLHPIRFDFLPVPTLGMAIRKDGALQTIGTFVPRGHFEITETAFMHTGQFEYDTRDNYRKKESPVILNGGEFEQIVSSNSWNNNLGPLNRTKYFILGGHIWMKEFTPGKHGDMNAATRHCAVSVLGGEYERFCLSGVFLVNNHVHSTPDNPHCYTNGGKFGIMSGAGMEDIYGNVTFKIDHSLIGEFYGGGLNAARPVTGSIDVTINNSIVGKYCGGPFTGDMLEGTTVTTVANNTIFGQFYGGGNGGTNFNRNRQYNNGQAALNFVTEANWRGAGKFDDFTPLSYVSSDAGYQAQFEFELIDMSSGSANNVVMRTYRHEAQFTATEVREVNSTLTDCTVLQDFYGGGNLGKVTGNVTSTLLNTTIWGSAYGGGNSSDVPSFPIHDKESVVFPWRDLASINHAGSLDYVRDDGEIRYYKWIHDLPEGVTASTNNPAFQYEGGWYCYTEKDMTNLGSVGGNTILNVNGNSKIYGVREELDGGNAQTFYDGAAFGGGNESAVFGNSTVTVDGDDDILVSNVYGGGNVATTGGSSNVVIYNGTIGVANEDGVPYVGSGNVFGGGKGLFEDENAGYVGVNTNVLITGGHVLRNVYGGSEYGNVGETNVLDNGIVIPDEDTGLSTITIDGGIVGLERSVDSIIEYPYGNVFGGGKGKLDPSFSMRTNVNRAQVNFNGGRIYGSVFGGGEVGHVLGNIEMNITDGFIGTYGYTDYDGSVFGGGLGADIDLAAGNVGGNVEVNVTGGTMLGSVYGGGRCGSVGFYLSPVDDTEHYGVIQDGDDHGYITVNITGGEIGHNASGENVPDYIGGYVYGGCKGIVEAPSATSIAEKMAYAKETTVNLFEENGHSPFIRGSVFGGSEDGHVRDNAHVNIFDGQVGGTELGNLTADGNSLHGNVYGGGRGWDQYYDEEEGKWRYCLTSGHVYGNAYVTITGGKVCRNVYGGGNLSSVGQYEVLLDEHGDPVLDENGNTQFVLDDDGEPIPVVGTGLAQIIISGGEIGNQSDEGRMHGNVFGSSRGMAGADFKELGCVHNTDVTIEGDAVVKGSVFGGGEDGHVNQNTKVTVNAGTIGVTEGDPFKGNVYGGGRGIDLDPNGATSPTAGLVKGHTRVYINGGNIINSVYGGGNMSLVGEERVVNVNGGLVKVNVFGGSKALPEGRVQLGMKTVNMRGGHVMGNVYGCNNNALDGDVDHPMDWTSFVNINGGEIDGNVFGAGYSCTVNGSVCVNIGKDAILNAPNKEYNLYYKDCGGDEPQYDPEGIEPTVSKLVIGNSVYGGSDFYGNNSNTNTWTDFIVSGYSNIYIDGTGYDTQGEGTNTEMSISGGLFGSSTHCESGAEGRHILLKNYGHRDDDGPNTEFTHATRTLKTIQRCGNLVIDHSNVNFSGMNDISGSGKRQYAVLKIDSTLYMANASGFVLGSPSVPAYMDSIRKVRSVHLKQASYSVYDVPFYPMLDDEDHDYWEWIGIKGDSEADAHLYYYSDLQSSTPSALTFSQENVLVFKGDSRLWVRYHRKEKQGDNWVDMGQYYGELEGFFRMRSPFQPWGTESFAYARPKISEGNTDNTSDGGFLSYDTSYNFFTDLGDAFTNTHQHPYTNVLQFFKGDRIDYREWVIREFRGRRWYVDGTRGWGRDDMSKTDGWGLYPDMPKKTVTGAVTYDPSTQTGNFGGICSEEFVDQSLTQYNYDFQNDIIYVVGALSAEDESALLQGGSVVVEGETQTYPLKLYRYPGGHPLNWSRQFGNEAYYDLGDGTLDLTTTNEGLTHPDKNGPGANYGAMLMVQEGESITLDNVQMDGLHAHTQGDDTYFLIPGNYYPDPDLEPYPVADPPIDPSTLNIPAFAQDNVSKPMIVTQTDSELTLMGSTMNGTGVTKFGTILERGYNNTNADVWYTNSDYYDAEEDVHHGGAIYVNSTATVNVENLVTVTGNLQNLQIGSDPAEAIECNVYLPTFDKHLNIIGEMALDEGTSIGVTSPIRNIAPHFVHNTFSPVAVALTQSQAESAWNFNNFHDDLDWFFSNKSYEMPRFTYYSTSIPDYAYPLTDPSQYINHFDPTTTLFFGWTWNNVVRSAPQDFALDAIDSPYDLAWLISLVNGSNRQTPSSDFSNTTIQQTSDIDLQRYVWVPIGAKKTGASQFAGTYDGQGHLIEHLDIAYIGEGDRRYERANYGLFGSVNNGVVDRTFVVSGFISPVGSANIGGLVGSMEGSSSLIANSEASVDIYCPDKENSENASGGLLGNMLDGEIHSSMAMPIFHANLYYSIGGLVGHTIGGSQGETVRKPKIYNSFANVKFDVDSNASVTIGGLIGINYGADMENCYLHLQNNGDHGLNNSNFALLAGLNNGGKIKYSYAYDQNDYPFTRVMGSGSDPNVSDCYKYTPVITADELGYLYSDNILTIGEEKKPMFTKLNDWVTDATYSKWARPTIPDINGDLPLLQLCNLDEDGNVGAGDFRSLGTFRGGLPQLGAFPVSDGDNQGVVLQYGGPIRDGNEADAENELDAMVDRMGIYEDEEEQTLIDYLYVYGDINNEVTAAFDATKLGKVSVYENAAILHPNTMAEFLETYVGVSFDNSCGHATSTPGLNHLGMHDLPRDWHMFSSPISNAPLGFDYMVNGTNSNLSEYYTGGDYGTYFNNPWPYLHQQTSTNGEFNWLNGGSTGDNRYWMKTFNLADQSSDGYFPTQRGALFSDPNNPDMPLESEIENLFIENSDEHPGTGRFCYPYGMDMFCWYEPEPHWINFKRNGPNHWHSDEYDSEQHLHAHLPYTENGISNQNEDNLVVGKGYMAAISTMTYLQSHGYLNTNDKSRDVTFTSNDMSGWNLIGNPYHAYLSFDAFANANSSSMNPYYVIYNADGYTDMPESAYIYYPQGGSDGGEYADAYLHPHQGFFVKAKGSVSLSFNEGMTVTRSMARTSSFRDWKPNYPLVNLYLSSENGCTDVTVVEFHRPEWGGATKQKELRQGNGQFYAFHDGEPYAALFVKEGAERVPLWFEAKENDVFTIKWNTANGYFSSLYLIDNLTGTRYDMLENESYVFEGRKQDMASRFYITFNCVDVEEHEEENEQSFAFFDGSQWLVTGEGLLELIDLQGRVLWQGRLSGGQSRVSLPSVAKSMYLLRLVNSEETKVQKIIAE